MGFADYFYLLAHGIFKRIQREGSDLDKLAGALGPNYDEAMEAVFALREQAMVATATGQALDALGKDRNMPRWPGEPDDLYRYRLLTAYSANAASGTLPGTQELLRVLGYPEAEIHELFKDGVIFPLYNGQHFYNGAVQHSGGVHWAEFKVLMNIAEGRVYTAGDAKLLANAIRRAKPAHTKLVAIALRSLLTDYAMPTEQIYCQATWTGQEDFWGSQLAYDGRRKYDGQHLFNAAAAAEKFGLAISMDTGQENIPGSATYVIASRYDGGGSRWKYNGGLTYAPYYRYTGELRYSSQLKYGMSQTHFGDKLFVYNGRRTYGWGVRYNGAITHGANGVSDRLALVVKRRGQVIEEAA